MLLGSGKLDDMLAARPGGVRCGMLDDAGTPAREVRGAIARMQSHGSATPHDTAAAHDCAQLHLRMISDAASARVFPLPISRRRCKHPVHRSCLDFALSLERCLLGCRGCRRCWAATSAVSRIQLSQPLRRDGTDIGKASPTIPARTRCFPARAASSPRGSLESFGPAVVNVLRAGDFAPGAPSYAARMCLPPGNSRPRRG